MPTTTYYKRSATGTTSLNSNTAWDSTSAGGSGQFGPPADINNDIAQWDTTSLGAGLTGAFTANQIAINPSASPAEIAHSSGTITLGTGGFSQALTNNRQWTESGTIAVGTSTQTWVLLNTEGSVSGATKPMAIHLTAASSLTGTSPASITLTNAGTTRANALLYITASVTGYSGQITLGNNTAIRGFSTSGLPSATINISGTNTAIQNQTNNNNITFLAVNADNDFSVGNPGGSTSFTLTAPLVLGGAGTSRTITVESASGFGTTLSGTITGAKNLVLAGTSGSFFTVTGSLAGLTGNLSIGTGTQFRIDTAANYTYAGSITGAGTLRKLTGTGTVTLTNSTISVSTITHESGTIEFSNAGAQAVSSAINSTGNITKSGAGTTTFSTAGNNTGNWTVNSPGTLAITASQTGGSGLITVNSGATLTTTANVASKIIYVKSGGTAQIGADTGYLHLNGKGTTLSATANTSRRLLLGYDASSGAATLTIPANRTLTTDAAGGGPGNAVGHRSGFSTGAPSAIYQTGANSLVTQTEGSASGYAENFFGGSSYGYYHLSAGNLTTVTNSRVAFGRGVFVADGGILSVGGALLIYGSTDTGALAYFKQGTHSAAGTQLGTTAAGYTGGLAALGVTGATTSVNLGSSGFVVSTGDQKTLSVSAGATLITAGISVSGTGPIPVVYTDSSTFKTTGTVAAGVKFLLGGNDNKLSASTTSTGIIAAAINPVTGYGISSVAMTNPGTNYIGPPTLKVTTTGAGVGAVVRAVYDVDSATITGIEVVCRGTGYLLADTTQVVVINHNSGSGFVAGEVTLNENSTDGKVEKIESGTLTLTGTNTNTGAYKISAGTLQIGAGGTSTSGTLGAGTGYGESPVILNGGTLAFARDQNIAYAGVISDGPSVTATSGIKKVATTTSRTVTLSGNSTFTGPISVEHGALQATAPTALGSLSATTLITVANAAQATFAFGAGVSVVSARGASLTGAGSQGALFASTGSTTLTGAVTITSTNNGATLDANNNAVIELAGVVSSGASATLTKGTNPGTLRLTNPANTLLGPIVVNGGTLSYKWAADTGASNSLGAGASNTVTVNPNGCLDYCGDFWGTTNRSLTLGTTAANQTVTLSASGDGPITYRQAPAVPSPASGTKTLVLGGSSGKANKIDFVIPTYNGVSLAKRGNGTWVLSQANTFTTNVAVEQGTLVAASEDGTARFGGASGSQTVTVSSGASVQTLTGTLQKGRHTYNNLTFQSGGKIRIGGSVSSGAVLMNGNLDLSGLATSQKVTWNLTDPMYKTNGTYDLVVFASGTLALPSSANPATATLSDYITVAPPSGKQAALSWVAATSSTRAKITVAITNAA